MNIPDWPVARPAALPRRLLLCLLLATAVAVLLVPGMPLSDLLTATPADGLQTPDAYLLLVLFLAALGCEYIDSALGMGYGTTLTPMLLLAGFDPLQVVPAILLSELVSGLLAGVLHQRDGNVDFLGDRRARRTVLLLSALSVAGAVVAVSVSLSLPRQWLAPLIAVIVLSIGLTVLATRRRQLRFRAGHLMAVGAVAAFNKGLSGGGYGPLVTAGQVVSGISARQAVAVTSVTEALTCLTGLAAYAALSGWPDWGVALPLALGAAISVPLATLTVRLLPDQSMRTLVGVATCLLGALTLWKALAGCAGCAA